MVLSHAEEGHCLVCFLPKENEVLLAKADLLDLVDGGVQPDVVVPKSWPNVALWDLVALLPRPLSLLTPEDALEARLVVLYDLAPSRIQAFKNIGTYS
jgi:hypothetical protein